MRRAWVGLLTVAVWGSACRAQARPIWSERPLLPASAARAPNVAALVKASWRSVVKITATSASASSADPLAAMLRAQPALENDVGSGFVIRGDGLILTDAHVVQGARELQVTFDDGGPRTVPAELLGIDPRTDVALLRIHPPHPLPALPLGESARVRVGQWVVAQGSPFGLAHSVSVGIISFVGRSEVQPEGFSGYRDYLQTDAAINPGSSGGPLLDLRGRVVGIANSVNPAGQGIAFALPIDMAKRELPALLAHGAVHRSWLGAKVMNLTPELAEAMGLDDSRGVVVAALDGQGPAHEAGLRDGDVIVRFDGAAVRHAQHLSWLVEAAPCDRAVRLVIHRGGATLHRDVRLRPDPHLPHRSPVEIHGARFEPVDVPTAREVGLPLPRGAKVVQGPGTAPGGLLPGDVVTRANGQEIDRPEDLARAWLRGDTPLHVQVRRGRRVLRLRVGPVQASR